MDFGISLSGGASAALAYGVEEIDYVRIAQ